MMSIMAGSSREQANRPNFLNLPAVRYPNEYVWLVFVSTIDIIFTVLLIKFHDYHEANPIAAYFLRNFGKTGLIVWKFFIATFVIVICEIVGRSQDRTGRWLARFGVFISALPMLVSLFFVIRWLTGVGPPVG